MNLHFVVVGSVLVFGGVATRGATPFTNKVVELSVPVSVLGDGWQGPSGLVLEDLKRPESWPAGQKEIIEPLATQLKAKKVTACADFSYTRRDRPSIVTLRVFVFADVESAVAWWQEKYAAAGWEKYYKVAPDVGDQAVDSVELPKRIVRVGNVLLTCHQLTPGDGYCQVLGHALARLSSSGAAKKSPPE